MRIHFQMSLSFFAKYLHFILIQTFVRAKLKLRRTILKINIADSMTYMLAPITCFCPFVWCTTALCKARFRTIFQPLGSCCKLSWTKCNNPFTPTTFICNEKKKMRERDWFRENWNSNGIMVLQELTFMEKRIQLPRNKCIS